MVSRGRRKPRLCTARAGFRGIQMFKHRERNGRETFEFILSVEIELPAISRHIIPLLCSFEGTSRPQ